MTNKEAINYWKSQLQILKMAAKSNPGWNRQRVAADKALKSLEKEEKYKWHNLTNNPADLPKQEGQYLVLSNNMLSPYMVCNYFADTHNFRNINLNYNEVIAWRKIEPCDILGKDQY